VQNAKIEFPQTFSQEALSKLFKKIQLLIRLDLYFSSKSDFFIFTLGEALEPLKNGLRIRDSCKETKTNIKTILISHNSMALPLKSTVIRVGKHSNLIVLPCEYSRILWLLHMAEELLQTPVHRNGDSLLVGVQFFE